MKALRSPQQTMAGRQTTALRRAAWFNPRIGTFQGLRRASSLSPRAPSSCHTRLTVRQGKRDIHFKPCAGLPSMDVLHEAAEIALSPHPGLLTGVLCNSIVYLLGIKVLLRGLTPTGVAHSWVLGTSIYAAFGIGGYALVCLYFIVGSAVTKLKLAQKQAEGIAEARGGRRGPSSVWGSGIAGLVCAVAALGTLDYDIWQIGFMASLASKLSDTVSSEVGKAYGRTTYLATSFKVVPRGTEGAVSLEGTLAGLAAAVVFAAIGCTLKQVDSTGFGVVVAAAVCANYFESCLGAAVQGNVPWLSNDIVNMLQISVAAGTAIALQAALA